MRPTSYIIPGPAPYVATNTGGGRRIPVNYPTKYPVCPISNADWCSAPLPSFKDEESCWAVGFPLVPSLIYFLLITQSLPGSVGNSSEPATTAPPQLAIPAATCLRPPAEQIKPTAEYVAPLATVSAPSQASPPSSTDGLGPRIDILCCPLLERGPRKLTSLLLKMRIDSRMHTFFVKRSRSSAKNTVLAGCARFSVQPVGTPFS